MSHFPLSLFKIFGSGSVIFLLVTILISTCHGVTNYLTDNDRVRLNQVFNSVWPPKEIPSVHYAILGKKLLGEPIPDAQEVCNFLIQSAQSNPTAETYYYVTLAWNSVGNCKTALPKSTIIKTFTDIIQKDTASVSDLYFATLGLKSLGQPLNTHLQKITKAIQTALKKDDSISNIGYSLHIAAQFGGDGGFAFDRIEDAIVQADEIDGKYLQFEGGLSITALLVSGALKLCEAVKRAPPLTAEQTVKFSNYFLSRRSVQSVKGAFSLLNVIALLSTNQFQNPIIVGLEGTGAVSLDNSKISVRVSDLLGRPLPFPLTVTLESATRVSDGVVILSKKKFQQNSGDKLLYSMVLLEGKTSETPGPYRLSVSAVPTSTQQVPITRLVGNVNVPLEVRIMANVVLAEPLQIGVADSDQMTQPKFHKVTMPNKLKETLEVDSLQKLAMRFSLKEKTTGKPIKVHQAFVRLLHHNTNQEVIFVTDVDANNNYKLDLDIGAKSSELGHLSGLYKVELIIGDSYVANSFHWLVADVKLNFGTDQTSKVPTQSFYKTKPEIQHLFREPERRPPMFVSNLFTGLVLLPLIILFIFWFQLGINLSNFRFSLSTIGFHFGLGAIFSLFGYFWLQLNMFETLKYLLGLGIVTFLCGNKLLANLALQQKR